MEKAETTEHHPLKKAKMLVLSEIEAEGSSSSWVYLVMSSPHPMGTGFLGLSSIKYTLVYLFELQDKEGGRDNRISLPAGSPGTVQSRKAMNMSPLPGHSSPAYKVVRAVTSRLLAVSCQEDGMLCFNLRCTPQLLKR